MEIHLTIDGAPVVRAVRTPPAFADAYDVVVVGLGTAGAEAFATCVKRGLKTFGVERLNGMGGLSTIGIVCFGGVLNRRLRDYERTADAAALAYETVVAGVWMERRRIVGVRTLSNGILRDVGAGAVIDATGSATITRMCGCALSKGRAFDGVMAPCARGETWLDNGKTAPRPIYRNFPDDLTRPVADVSATATKMARHRHAFWLTQKTQGRLLRPSMMIGAREETRVVTEETATPRFAGNFALALALMDDARAVPALRDLVAHPGGPTDPVVAGAFPNRIKALDMLGRFADAKSAPLLVAIVADEARAFTDGKQIVKTVVVPGRLVNIVLR